MVQFMTADWAAECQRVLNGWPDEERKASKLQDFWDWINMISPFVTGQLALSVRDMPAGGEGDTLVLDFDAGNVTAASVQERGAAEPDAVFLLAGSTPTGSPCWTAMTSARWSCTASSCWRRATR